MSPEEELPPLPDEEELPPLDNIGETLPPLPVEEDGKEFPPLPKMDEKDMERVAPPMPPNSQPSEELPPPPDMVASEHASNTSAQPNNKGVIWMLIFAVAAIYITIDAWQAAQSVELAQQDTKDNIENTRLAEKETEKAIARSKQIVSISQLKEEVQALEDKIEPIIREKKTYSREIEQLTEKKNELRRQIEKLEEGN